MNQLQQENKQLKIDLDYQKKITADKVVEADKYIDFLNDEIIKLREKLVEKNKEIETLESNNERLIDDFQQERENLCKEIQKHSDARKRAVEIIKDLHKEIDELKFNQRNFAGLIEKVSEKGQNQLRHEICEKIRDECVYVAGTKRLCENTSISTYNLNEILNQIERGEK